MSLVGEDTGEGFEPAGDGSTYISRGDATNLLPEACEDTIDRPGAYLVRGQVALGPVETVGYGLQLPGPRKLPA